MSGLARERDVRRLTHRQSLGGERRLTWGRPAQDRPNRRMA